MIGTEEIKEKVREKATKRAKRWGMAWTSWITGKESKNNIEHFSHFSPWFNSKCFSVIISEEERRKYRLGLWIHEEIFKQVKEVDERNVHFIKVLTGSTSGEAKRKADRLEKELISEDKVYKNHPILVLIEWGEKPIHFSDIVKKASIAKENILTNPDDYIKRYDIIAVKINNTPSYHVAIYQGSKNIAHIPDNRGNPARPDTLNKFLESRNVNEIISNRLIIPFQRPERIEDNINEAIEKLYGKDNYDVTKRNCEHFATLCVTGIKFSSQVENLFNLNSNFRLSKEEINEETLNNNNFAAQIQVRKNN